MALAIFDLDNTLIAGDSDHAWGEFLVEKALVDEREYRTANDQFYQDYLNGELDMNAYLAFALKPLTRIPASQLFALRDEFLRTRIDPLILPKARDKIAQHKRKGDFIMIISATNRFVTEPISERFGVDHLIATDPEVIDGQYTGKVAGIPSFQEGKVTRLNAWLEQTTHSLEGAWFYSDSHNDLPLLELVDHPVAVDPDARLLRHAEQQGWTICSFRDTP